MKSPFRAGTLVSAVLLLLVLWTICRHTEYLKDRWTHIDDIKDDIAGGLRAHLGSSNDKATSIDPKYLGFGTPTPQLTPTGTPPTNPHAAATPALGFGQGSSDEVTNIQEDTTATADSDETEQAGAVVDELDGGANEEGVEDAAESEPLEGLPDKIVVMGKMSQEDTSWVGDYLPDWQQAIYTVDDVNATLHTPMNKGKEAMAYLTYMIENYGRFPATVAFLHSHKDRFWHSDGMPARSNAIALKALSTGYVQQAGFANLRCSLGPGCPAEVQPYRADSPAGVLYEKNMTAVWELFFGTQCPEVIAAPCCAQFAVSRAQLMARPVADYVRYRQWLMETPIDDDNSGRIFEYLWHIIFGQEPVHCPDYGSCWANVYGGASGQDIRRLMGGGDTS